MIVKMAKVRIVGPKTTLQKVTDILYERGILHVEPSPLEIERGEEEFIRKLIIDEEGLKKKVLFEKLLDEIKRLLLILSPVETKAEERPELRWLLASDPFLADVTEFTKEIGKRLDFLANKKKEYEDEITLLEKYEGILTALSPFIFKVREMKDIDYIGITIKKREEAAIPLIKEAIARITNNEYEIFFAPLDEETIASLLLVNKKYSNKVKTLLWEERISELRLPSSVADKPFAEAIKTLLEKKRELPEKLDGIKKELMDLSLQWYQRLTDYKKGLEEALAEIVITAYFYQTKLTFIIYGWIPRTDVDLLCQQLEKEFGGKVLLEELEIQEKEISKVPVFLKNPRIIKPFELFMRLLPLPIYGTIDPTPFLAIFFPIFFGTVLGDIGYGLITLVLSVFINKRYSSRPFLRDMSYILIISSIYTIIFGFLYGEFFGELMKEYMEIIPFPYFHRSESIIPLLIFSISIGTAHVLLGIILGLITSLRLGHRRESIAKIAKLLVILAIVGSIGCCGGIIPEILFTPSIILLAIAFPVLIISGGLLAPLETFKALGNILSYVRLMAIGLSSVFLASVANKLGGMTGNILLGIFIGGILHLFNILLGLFSPTIHSLRLHYVEFFGKFFQPGGKMYTPFKKKEA